MITRSGKNRATFFPPGNRIVTINKKYLKTQGGIKECTSKNTKVFVSMSGPGGGGITPSSSATAFTDNQNNPNTHDTEDKEQETANICFTLPQ